MPRKPDLSKALGQRFKTEEKVDVQDPIAAAIQASQQANPEASTDVSQPAREQESVPEDKNARMHAYTPDAIPESVNVSTQDDKQTSKQTRKSASGSARKQERTEASEEAYIGKGVIIEVLYDQIQQKKHLSNGSFRYKADELEKLDAIHHELEQKKPGRISKNDIARMALIAFYEDYEKNGDESILAQVFKRM